MDRILLRNSTDTPASLPSSDNYRLTRFFPSYYLSVNNNIYNTHLFVRSTVFLQFLHISLSPHFDIPFFLFELTNLFFPLLSLCCCKIRMQMQLPFSRLNESSLSLMISFMPSNSLKLPITLIIIRSDWISLKSIYLDSGVNRCSVNRHLAEAELC